MPEKPATNELDGAEQQALLDTLRTRFEKNMPRHQSIRWEDVQGKLESDPQKLRALAEMERTGGEPDVVGPAPDADGYLFIDCSKETPSGRRSCCYDREAREGRKKHPPENSAMEMAAAMGAELLDEAAYRRLQEYGPVDTKTSSWLLTPEPIRKLGGAIFGDYRYGTIFVYHNGADSYYAARGFRCALRVQDNQR